MRAPRNSQLAFLTVCGAVGMGQLITQGNSDALKVLRAAASDSRWRVREGVAMGLQRLGDTDIESLLSEMKRWSPGNFLEMRVAAAFLCEPRLLKQTERAKETLIIVDRITTSISSTKNRNTDAFKALRKSMGYCWSVAVAASPDVGMSMIEQWLSTKDKDIRWIMREDLKKKRLERINAAWVQNCRVGSKATNFDRYERRRIFGAVRRSVGSPSFYAVYVFLAYYRPTG